MSLGRWILPPLAALSAGCASVPTHYYTLMRESSPQSITSTGGVRLQVEPVRIPAQVDRPEIVTRSPRGGIALAENEQWIAPLADELQNAVSVELLQKLAFSSHSELTESATVSLQMQVERFESSPSRYALIEASWSARLKARGTERVVCGRSEVSEPVGAGYAELVRGHQRAVARLADAIAVALRQQSGVSLALTAP